MKLILTKTLAELGRAGDLVDVSDAHARNFLIPKRFGKVATSTDVKRFAQTKQTQQATQQRRQAEMARDRERLAATPMRLAGKANPKGTLFAALHGPDVVTAARQLKIDLTGCTFEPAQIKSLGQHQLQVKWPDGQTSTLTVEITHG